MTGPGVPAGRARRSSTASTASGPKARISADIPGSASPSPRRSSKAITARSRSRTATTAASGARFVDPLPGSVGMSASQPRPSTPRCVAIGGAAVLIRGPSGARQIGSCAAADRSRRDAGQRRLYRSCGARRPAAGAARQRRSPARSKCAGIGIVDMSTRSRRAARLLVDLDRRCRAHARDRSALMLAGVAMPVVALAGARGVGADQGRAGVALDRTDRHDRRARPGAHPAGHRHVRRRQDDRAARRSRISAGRWSTICRCRCSTGCSSTPPRQGAPTSGGRSRSASTAAPAISMRERIVERIKSAARATAQSGRDLCSRLRRRGAGPPLFRDPASPSARAGSSRHRRHRRANASCSRRCGAGRII